MEKEEYPKILIISRGVWDDTSGTSSTLSNVFSFYNPEKLAHIYIETKIPNTRFCNKFFQISEFSLINKLYKWNTKTGFEIDTHGNVEINKKTAENEDATMNFVRHHRSMFFTLVREFLWLFNGWKSKELRQFITDYNPDIIWMDGSPLILMNRLGNYIRKICSKPFVIFLQDDAYTYDSCSSNLASRIYRYFLRKQINRIVKGSSKVFVASPKMKSEYDEIFGIDSTFLTKGIDFSKIHYNEPQIGQIIRFVYLGQVIYGRIHSLIALAQAMARTNEDEVKMTLSVYTNNDISDNLKQQLVIDGTSNLYPAVPYTEVPKVIGKHDVLVFVESFEPNFKNVARLSFSTKITDYLASGKCILGIGPDNIAPMEYLKVEDAGIIVSNLSDLSVALDRLTDKRTILEYSRKSFECAKKNHDAVKMDNLKIEVFKSIT